MTRYDFISWDISDARAIAVSQDESYQRYKRAWQKQWDKVKHLICGKGVPSEYDDTGDILIKRGYNGYDCEVLDRLDLDRPAN